MNKKGKIRILKDLESIENLSKKYILDSDPVIIQNDYDNSEPDFFTANKNGNKIKIPLSDLQLYKIYNPDLKIIHVEYE